MRKLINIFLITISIFTLTGCHSRNDEYDFEALKECVSRIMDDNPSKACLEQDANTLMTDYGLHLLPHFDDENITIKGVLYDYYDKIVFGLQVSNLNGEIITNHKVYNNINNLVLKDLQEIMEALDSDNYLFSVDYAEKEFGEKGSFVSYTFNGEESSLKVKISDREDITLNLEQDLKDIKNLYNDNFTTADIDIYSNIGEISLNLFSGDKTYYYSIVEINPQFSLEARTFEDLMIEIFPNYTQQ